ncbi:MAG: hypothetical protein AAF805_05635 [Planctomycetota bacterium]
MNRAAALLIAASIAATPFAATAEADRPGPAEITGRIVLLGEPPASLAIDPGPDACCQAAGPIDERLVVGPDGGLANVVVSIETRRGEARPPVIASGVDEAITLTNLGCAFRPRVAVVRIGGELRLANDDPTMHNVAIDFVRNPAVNVVVEPGGERRLTLAAPERRPVPVRCNVHPFMAAWVVVRSDEYAAITGADGRFALPSPPEGEWRLRLWHEGAALSGVEIGDALTDRRGEAAVRVLGNGGLDLGNLSVTADRFR